jgi:outer membrane protein assembly factor BamB
MCIIKIWVAQSNPMEKVKMKKIFLIATILVTVSAISGWANNWPHYLGPNDNATSSETGLLREWPEAGPTVLWTVPLGHGYGAPAVYDGKVYVLDREGTEKDIMRCFDLATGKEEWQYAYSAEGRYGHDGSRCVPSVNEDRIYSIGQQGDLYCFDKKTQKPLWNKHIREGFGEGGRLGWGFGQNPLLYKDTVIVAPMAEKAGVVALDQVTGNVRWSTPALPGNPSYVSPKIYKIAGEDHVVMISAENSGRSRRGGGGTPQDSTSIKGAVLGMNPDTGEILWSYDGWQCRIPIPNMVAIGDDRFFITGGYEAGSAMIRVKKAGQKYEVEELYTTQDFGVHCHPPVLYKDHLFGHCTTNTRRDGMVCLNVDGTQVWKTGRDPVFDKGGFILVDDLIISVDGKEGVLFLIEPSIEGFKPISSVKLLEPGEIWAPLALVDGKLLIRDQTQMKCLQVR